MNYIYVYFEIICIFVDKKKSLSTLTHSVDLKVEEEIKFLEKPYTPTERAYY